MTTLVTVLLRALIVVIFLGCLFAQIAVVPQLARETADLFPEVTHLEVPYMIAAILVILCAQVALIALWQLLSMVGRDMIFSGTAFKWVDLIIWCIAGATAITGGVFIHMGFIEHTGGPANLYLFGLLVVGVALALLMVVMRGLLKVATTDHSELAEVI